MRSFIVYAIVAAVLPLTSISQPWGGAGGFGGWSAGFPSCASACTPQENKNDWSNGNWGESICNNKTLISNVNSCVSSSSCSNSDKQIVYQKVASLCASTGATITAAPEASFTGLLLTASWSSGPWSGRPWSASGPFPSGWQSNQGPWNGKGPFGGNWGDWSSGAWTSGPWMSWWGGSGCPGSSWTGWTSGPWTSGAPWTSWTACVATTTATTTFTTMNTAGAIITETNLGIQVAEKSTTGTNSASPSQGRASSGRGEARQSLLVLFVGFSGVMMVVMVVL